MNHREKTMRELFKDEITGLPNRVFLENLIELDHCKHKAMAILKIGNLKKFMLYLPRDTFREIVKSVSYPIVEVAKRFDFSAYRTGNDSYAFISVEEKDNKAMVEFCSELIRTIEKWSLGVKLPGDLSDFVGGMVELYGNVGFSTNQENLYSNAYHALRFALERNERIMEYNQEVYSPADFKKRMYISKIIRDAIEQDQISPYFQPIYDSEGNIVKYEVLMRIIKDKNEIISPGAFLGIAKETNKYFILERLVLKKAIQKLIETPAATLSINLSARDMLHEYIGKYLLEIIAKHNIGRRIVFEIVEDEDLEQIMKVSEFISKAKELQVRIAIDDFGSGYSNFAHVIKMQPDYLKIDGSLIKIIDWDKKSQAIASAIIKFAKELKIKTIAEYVHSKEVLEFCKGLGVDEFQGFYLSPPIPDLAS